MSIRSTLKFTYFVGTIIMLFQITYTIATRESGNLQMRLPILDYSYVTLSVLFLIVFAVTLTTKRKVIITRTALEILFFIMLLTAMFLITVGIYQSFLKSTFFLIYWMFVEFFFIYFYLRVTSNEILEGAKKSLYPIFIFCLLATIVALLVRFNVHIDILNISKTQSESSIRMTGWLGNPNRMGNVAGIGIIIGLSLYLMSVRRRKLMLLTISMMVIGLLMTGSKGSILAVIVSASVLFNFRLLIKYITAFAVIGSVSIATISYFATSSLLSFDNLSKFVRLDSLDNGRSEIWNIMFGFWESGIKHILFGGVDLSLSGFSAHSIYFHLLFYFGIIALVIFLFFSIYFLVISFKKTDNINENILNRSIVSLFIYILIDGLVESLLFKLSFEFYTFLFVIALKAATSNSSNSRLLHPNAPE